MACSFCQGRPVLSGLVWIGADVPHYVACPRCGAMNHLHCASCGVELAEGESGRCAICWQRETASA